MHSIIDRHKSGWDALSLNALHLLVFVLIACAAVGILGAIYLVTLTIVGWAFLAWAKSL